MDRYTHRDREMADIYTHKDTKTDRQMTDKVSMKPGALEMDLSCVSFLLSQPSYQIITIL